MIDDIDTDFTDVDIGGAEDEVAEEVLDELADFDGEELDENAEFDLTDADMDEDEDHDLVSLAEEYYESVPSVQHVITGKDLDSDDFIVAGYNAVVAVNQNGHRLSIAPVIGDDVDAAGTVVQELTLHEGSWELIVEDGCGSDLNWVADSIKVIERSVLKSQLSGDTDETVKDSETKDAEDSVSEDSDGGDGSEEIGVKSIPELGDYMTPKEMWGDASTFYADGNNEQAREMAAGALMAEMDWLCIRDTSEPGNYDLRVYNPNKGCYVEGGTDTVEERMTRVMGGVATNGAEINKATQLVANNCKVDLDETDAEAYDETLIPFRNGVLVLGSVDFDADTDTIDPESAELREKSPEYNFTHALPVDWDPESDDIELVEQWMGDMTDGDEVKERTLWEAGGHALLPRYEPQGFIIVIAEGSNGKTTLFNVFLEALGEENTTSIPLDKINDSRFSAYRMVDRFMNMHADIGGSTLDDVSALKAATGDDRMEVERKGIDPWDERNRATQLMAANSPPTIVEMNKAVKRRLMPVILDVEFVTDADPENPYEIEKDPEMEDRLTEDSALAAIAFKFVEAARRLQEQREFTMTKEYDGDERMRLYESYADPVADFDRSCLERDPAGSGIAIDDIKACYDAFARDKDHPSKKRETLIRMLKKRTTTVMRRSDPRSWTDDDGRTPIYKGMQFTDKAKENWLPEDAHWDQYGRPDTDDATSSEGAASDRVTLAEVRGMEPDRLDDEWVRVTVASELDPRPWLHAEAVLKDETDTVRMQSIGEHTLEEDETYVIEDPTVIPTDSDNHLQLVPAQTSVTKVDIDGDQTGLPDCDGDGEPVKDDNAGSGYRGECLADTVAILMQDDDTDRIRLQRAAGHGIPLEKINGGE